ncbi:hypothetical protein N7528_007550 [Penicillium herquei]|nr:hypothetical protein N7528_007550 [Penicillium herquei]
MAAVEIKDDYDIQEAWNKACGSFAQTTEVNLTVSPQFTVDEVLDQIRKKQDEKDDEKGKKYKAAKDIIGKTLTFITVLGGIVAEGASMVFAPSSLCFNAISYLIATGAKYKRIFTSLTELFQKISDVLERCKIYLRLPAEAVDISLRKIINEELVCFVDICALSIKVLKGNRVLTALKVFAFDSDEGVGCQLTRLTDLVERESQMRATLGFESQKISERAIAETRDRTKRVSASVNTILDFEKKRDSDSQTQRLLKIIDGNLDTPSDTLPVIQAAYKRLLNEQVPGSGAWLQEDSQYTSWINTQQSKSRYSILGLTGEQGSGKSVLFSTIVRNVVDLQFQAKEGTADISTAYYIFDQEPSLIKALQVLSWQIAKTSLAYRKDLSNVKTTSKSQVSLLCEQLFGKSPRSNATFYLLLDGIDRMDKQHLKHFVQILSHWSTESRHWPHFTLRILLSGRTETMKKIHTDLPDIKISIIDMASKNSDDISHFINDRMEKMEILSGGSSQVMSLRAEILESLIKKSDFVNLGLLLDDISSMQRSGEIREVLSRSGESRSDTIDRKIESLNKTLSNDDISDLNTLLTWVLFAAEPMSIQELEVVLFLKAREPSLRPLAEKVRDQYSSIFRMNLDCLYLVSDSIGDFFRQSPVLLGDVHGGQGSSQGGSLDDTSDVNETEVKVVSRFLELVCDPQLFKKFGFDEFFQNKMKGKSIRLGVDPETAHLTILSACLEVICSEESPYLDPLLEYASQMLADHLAQVDLSLISPQQKMILGPQLLKAFTDDKVINRWWDEPSLQLRCQWIYSDQYTDIVFKWLQDSAVTKGISEEHKGWLSRLSSKSELDADLIEHVARALSRQWLQSSKNVFSSIYGYSVKISSRKDPKIQRQTKDPDPSSIKASDIFDTASWAQNMLGLDNLGYEENRNLARTFRAYGMYSIAIEQFKHTSTLVKNNWYCQFGLAQCYVKQGEYSIAIDIVETTRKEVDNATIEDSSERVDLLNRMNEYLAEWNGEIGRTEIACDIYEKLLQDMPDDAESGLKFIVLLAQRQEYTRLLDFLQSLQHVKDEETGGHLRNKHFHENFDENEYHKALSASVTCDRNFDIILEYYNEAIDAAKTYGSRYRNAGNSFLECCFNYIQFLLTIEVGWLSWENGAVIADRRKFAADQFMRTLNMDDLGNPDIVKAKDEICQWCSTLYLQQAREYPDTAAEYLGYVQDVQNVASRTQSDQIVDLFGGKYPTCVLAIYHRLQGDNQKAKDILRTFMKLYLDLLSDDDPLNDWQGYNGLAIYLMFAGLHTDALAAWSLITPINDRNFSRDCPENEDPEGKLEGPLLDICEADCGTSWSFAGNFYICTVCPYVQFDQQCLDKHRKGELDRDLTSCLKEHEMLYVPAYDSDQRKRIGEGNVKVGEEIMPVNEWLQRIREDWGIDSA